MDAILFYSLLVKTGFALGGVYAARLFLGHLDKRCNIDFEAVIDRINESAQASALYFGLRFLGVCYLIGTVVA